MIDVAPIGLMRTGNENASFALESEPVDPRL